MNEFWNHYKEIVSDPAHVAAEVTFVFVLDVLILGLLWPLFKRALHKDIDKQHGVTHDNQRQQVEDIKMQPTESGFYIPVDSEWVATPSGGYYATHPVRSPWAPPEHLRANQGETPPQV